MKQMKRTVMLLIGALLTSANLFASEADIAIPDLHAGEFHIFGQAISSWDFLFYGALVICVTLSISLWLFSQVKKLRAHDSMLKVSEIIFALSSTMEGDTTNFYIFRKLADTNVKLSVIARGISIGDELEYTDEVTLGRSIANRTLFTGTV